ncbi:DUF2974 domain-containing protein [Streptococcus sanguinis]|uniref:DUF2974 domain-containing protein n=1 Tax=Streptococcus sanguinis TaxID=1305 RepID=A0AAE8K9Y5_STRSA|nr:DUF2974 domain-containing protein [Streptococcus sanguinis]RSI08798.1 hypothetical protein D8888_07225 [Streptococcus sanguinis]
MISYDDREKNEIAWKQYNAGSYKIGKEITIEASDGSDITIGYVSDIFSDSTGTNIKNEDGLNNVFKRMDEERFGLDGYVITDKEVGGNVKPEDVKEITVLFQGSEFDFSSIKGAKGTINDWGITDTQMAANILRSRYLGINKGVAKQQELAAKGLKEMMDKYPNARVSLYAHSLGSMDGQVALASLEDSYLQRIDGAYLYEGPNTYLVLTDKQRKQVDKIKYKIFNYVDPKDFIAMQYPETGSEGVVGTLVKINSKGKDDWIQQHMWGGYEYDSGYLNVRESDLQDYRLARAKQAMEQLDIKKKALSERYQKMVAAGYTRSEMIYLDSEQATTFASSLQNLAAISTEAIMAFCDYGVSKVSGRWDALLAQAQAMPNVSRLLSEAEVIDALAQVGATKDTVETSIITELKDMRNKAVKTKEEFDGLSSKLLNGIQELVKKDEGLAREYKRWGNI